MVFKVFNWSDFYRGILYRGEGEVKDIKKREKYLGFSNSRS